MAWCHHYHHQHKDKTQMCIINVTSSLAEEHAVAKAAHHFRAAHDVARLPKLYYKLLKNALGPFFQSLFVYNINNDLRATTSRAS